MNNEISKPVFFTVLSSYCIVYNKKLQIYRFLRNFSITVYYYLKVGDWSKWVLRIVALLSEQILCLDVDFYSISIHHFEA